MPTLYSYVVAHDNGAAPNPFGGVCTLVLCKPAIRRVAQVGDWIVGTGSANSPIGDTRGRVVYAMRVTETMPLWQYDGYAQTYLPDKLPAWRGGNPVRMVGDAQYDFSYDPPRLRRGVHVEKDRRRDLSGLNAVLSEHFYYFGDLPRALPEPLTPIVVAGQGHRSVSNAPYLEPFVEWIEGLGLEPNRLYGRPNGSLFSNWQGDSPPSSSCSP